MSAQLAALHLDHVVVPLDGSGRAERALPVARWLKSTLHARIDVVSVAPTEYLATQLHSYLASMGADAFEAVVGDDPAREIELIARRLLPSIVCLASHGHGRSAALVGSVANDLIGYSSPTIVASSMRQGPPLVLAPVYDPISPTQGVLDYIATNPVQLLAVVSRASTGIGRLILGSTAANLVHHATVPVLITGEATS